MVRFPPWAWVTFAVVLLGLLAIDMACHRGARCDSPRRAAVWSAVWIGVGLAFAIFVQAVCCHEAAADYLAAYLIEKSLSLDNLFVFLVVFRSLRIPDACQRTALTWGVLGALVLRGAFVGAGSAAVQRFDAVTFVFGGLLLVAAWRALRQGPTHVETRRSLVVTWLLAHLPVAARTYGSRFVVRLEGRLLATPLLVAVIGLELTDIVFAVDSVPAAFSITDEPFLIYSSNAFAILGLRSLYLVVAATLARLAYIHYGLAAVLAFAGLKIVAERWVHVPAAASIGFVVLSIGLAAWASARWPGPPRAPEPKPKESGELVRR